MVPSNTENQSTTKISSTTTVGKSTQKVMKHRQLSHFEAAVKLQCLEHLYKWLCGGGSGMQRDKWANMFQVMTLEHQLKPERVLKHFHTEEPLTTRVTVGGKLHMSALSWVKFKCHREIVSRRWSVGLGEMVLSITVSFLTGIPPFKKLWQNKNVLSTYILTSQGCILLKDHHTLQNKVILKLIGKGACETMILCPVHFSPQIRSTCPLDKIHHRAPICCPLHI